MATGQLSLTEEGGRKRRRERGGGDERERERGRKGGREGEMKRRGRETERGSEILKRVEQCCGY